MAATAQRKSNVRSLLGATESWLLGSTALADNSLFAFGVSKARMTVPREKLVPTFGIAQSVGDTLSDIRERIKEFLDGSFDPKRLQDLLNYLSERMLRLETRRSPDGSIANYLVDGHTQQPVLASLVDGRLSRPGIARAFGRTIEAEAEEVRRRIARTPEQVLAMTLRNQNAGRLLTADNAVTPFEDWDDVMFSAPAMFDGREVCLQGDELWIGTTLALASEDPEENRRMMKKAQLEGRRLIYPAASPADVAAGRLTPGMPILLKEGAIRMRMIDPRLSGDHLSVAFGLTLRERFMQMQQRYSSKMKELRSGRAADDKVVDLAAFRRQFARTAVAAPAPVIRSVPLVSQQASKATTDYSIRHEIGHDGREKILLIDRRSGDEILFRPSEASAGRYVKEDGFGLPSGYLIVDAKGGYSHLDMQDRFHNPLGPAIVPSPDSGEKVRYAIDGEFHANPDERFQVLEDDMEVNSPVFGRK